MHGITTVKLKISVSLIILHTQGKSSVNIVTSLKSNGNYVGASKR